jgi:hypothetical protein
MKGATQKSARIVGRSGSGKTKRSARSWAEIFYYTNTAGFSSVEEAPDNAHFMG